MKWLWNMLSRLVSYLHGAKTSRSRGKGRNKHISTVFKFFGNDRMKTLQIHTVNLLKAYPSVCVPLFSLFFIRICSVFSSLAPPGHPMKTDCLFSTCNYRTTIRAFHRRCITIRSAHNAWIRTSTKKGKCAWVCWARGRGREVKRGHPSRPFTKFFSPFKVSSLPPVERLL